MSDQHFVQRCIRQFQKNIYTRSNGDRIIACGGGLFDLFSGMGWSDHARYRIIRTKTSPIKQFIQVSGTTLSREYRNELLKENG